MNKLEKLADRLQASIDFATEHNEDFEASSWNYQEGVLLNHNEAKLVVELVKKLTLTDVSQQRELLNALADDFNNSTDTYVGQTRIEEVLKAFNCG
tara:strand:+ start:262 stop:549 length:288 start_codon:yes stop_codon:yes gene_type:complete